MKLQRSVLAVPLSALLVLGACGDDDDSADTVASAPTITIGAADFSESQLLAEIYGQALEGSGFRVARKDPIGPRELYYQAIDDNEIQLVPEYTGALLSFVVAPEIPTAATIDEQVTALGEALPENLTVGAASAAEDKDVIVCRQDVADEYGLTNLTGLITVADQLTLGAKPELDERKTFGEELTTASFKEFVPLQSGEVVDALKGSTIDCGGLFSTMSQITTEGFVALDDEGRVTPQAVLPLMTTEAATPEVISVVDQISAKLTTDALKAMMVRIEVDKEAPDVVAGAFLAGQITATSTTLPATTGTTADG